MQMPREKGLNNSDKIITFRVREELKQKIYNKAKLQRMTMTEYIIGLIEKDLASSLEYIVENLIIDEREEVISFEDLVATLCDMIRSGGKSCLK